MELTPELFEKTEFAERRKGYDIDQVETFMEDAGTALAQMLARVRHTEERAAHAESRLAQADEAIAAAQERALQAERAAQQAVAEAGAARSDDDAEVEQAAKTLLMAKRTAEATVNEARGHAQSVLEEAQTRAQRQLDEAHAESQELLRRATEQAEAEFADRRAGALEEVEHLEARRSQLSDVIAGLESRLAAYREELGEVAADLVRLAEDPERLGARPAISILPDEVITAETGAEPVADAAADRAVETSSGPAAAPGADPGHTAGVDDRRPGGSTPDAVIEDTPGAAGADGPTASASGAVAGPASTAHEEASEGTTTVVADSYVDLTEADDATSDAADWGPGSWAQVEAQLEAQPAEPVVAQEPDDRPTEAVSGAAPRRDRYMEELDSAVNEAVELDDDAMKAFFEGTTDSRARRFGWRR